MVRILVSGLVLLATFASPASAIEERTPEPDRRYRVVDVSPDSALNLRAQPGLNAPVIGQLNPDGEDLVVTGVRREVDGDVWWQLPFDGVESGVAWANAHYLTPVDAFQDREKNFSLACSGVEPFWSLRTEEGEGVFSRLGDEREERWSAGTWRRAEGQKGRFALPLKSRKEGEVQGYAAITRTYRFCYDGMSDFQYPYGVLLMTPSESVLSGCCRRLR